MTNAATSRTFLMPLHQIRFSTPSFIHGLGGGLCVLALLGMWMSLRAGDTLTRVQENMPAKTAVIEWIKTAPQAPAATQTPDDAATEDIAATSGLIKAPVEGLFEMTPAGQLPIANLQTGQTPFDVYKMPFTPVPGRAPIAVMFLGGGLSESLSAGILADLPAEVSVAISPYALSPASWMDKIRADGHEVWLTLPLQNDTYPEPDPGPNTILSSVSPEQNQDRLMRILASGAGYVGLISLDDHNFTAANTDIIPVMQQIFGRGLAFIDGRPERTFFGADIAKSQSYPYADANMIIGEDVSPNAAKALLARAEMLALEKGQALVFVRPTPATIRAVAEWSPTVDTRGLQLVPPSALVTQ